MIILDEIFKYIYLGGEKSKYIITPSGKIYNSLTNQRLSTSSVDKDGYPLVNFSHKGRHYTKKVHKLVGIYFIPNPLNKPELHHIDGDVTNFNKDNLIWCTKKEHFELERQRVGKFNRAKGERQGSSKYSDIVIRQAILDLSNGKSRKYVCEKYGINYHTIHKIYNKLGWCHLTEDIEFAKLNMPKRDIYSNELKNDILRYSAKGFGPKHICEELNLEYTPKLKNYIKTLVRRKNNRNESSTTIENNEYYTIDIC